MRLRYSKKKFLRNSAEFEKSSVPEPHHKECLRSLEERSEVVREGQFMLFVEHLGQQQSARAEHLCLVLVGGPYTRLPPNPCMC